MNLKQLSISFFLVLSLFIFSGCEEDTTPDPEALDQDSTYVEDYIDYVVDGDTIEFYDTGRVRLYGVDTPETYQSSRLDAQADACAAGDKNIIQLMGGESTNYVRSAMSQYSYYDLKILGLDTYDRTIAVVIIPIDGPLNKLLVRDGFAVPFMDSYNLYEEDLIFAKNNNRGLWKHYHSEMDCLSKLK